MRDRETWIARRLGAARDGRRVLVVCRTRASLSMVRLWAARCGGVVGLEAVLPAALAPAIGLHPRLVGRQRGLPDDLVPRQTAIGERIGARPGLSAVARRWVQRVRGAERIGASVSVPPWLRELVDTGWGASDEEDVLTASISAIAPGAVASAWDEVVAIGFDRPAGALAPWEPELVRRLCGRLPSPPPADPRPIEAHTVPDVVAEARLAAKLSADDPEGTLILVSDPTTAARVRDTLARNRLPCTWRDNDTLEVHRLASVVRRCATWFADAPDPPIQIGDLSFVLSAAALHHRLHPAAEEARRALLGDSAPLVEEIDQRDLVEALERTRLLDAPLSAWSDRLSALADDRIETEPRLAAASATAATALALLRASIAARPFEDALGELTGAEPSFDADDFEDVLATLLGEETAAATALPPGDRLGAVARFLTGCRIRIGDDPVACAILGSLRARAAWPVTPSHVHQALSGTLDLGVLTDGVDVISVDDWDGRPCRLLLLLDVHDHGLTRSSPPDPLLDDGEIAALGALSGREEVEERIAQIHRAAARAERVLAIVTRRDAGGREVVPPIQLELVQRPLAVPSYGWRMPGLPENEGLVLEAEVDPEPARAELPPPEHPDPIVRHLAVQATAEWVRAGRGPLGPSGEAPPWLAPYLGVAEGAPEAGLPDREHSVSRLLRPLVHCPYQAFVGNVLGLKRPRQISQDLEPVEVGIAVHGALERVADSVWRIGRGDRESRKRQLVDRLSGATERAFEDAIGPLGPLSQARRASADGRRDRWNAHWPQYVDSRTLPPPNPILERLIDSHPVLAEAIASFRRAVPVPVEPALVRAWVLWAARTGPEALPALPPRMVLRRGSPDELPAAVLPHLPAVTTDPVLAELREVLQTTPARMEAWRLVPVASLAEVGFGEEEQRYDRPSDIPRTELGRTVLRLGSREIAVRGRIDRIDVLETPHGERLAAVIDYKTGQQREAWQFRRDQLALRDPQLLLYAMVVSVAGRDREDPAELRGVRVAVVAEDRVEQVVREPEMATRRPAPPDTWIPVDGALLRWAARTLGAMLDEARAGRWPLRPRPDTCPMLTVFGHDQCPVAGACRLRELPSGAEPR